MLHTLMPRKLMPVRHSRIRMLITGSIVMLCLTFVSSLLVSCGSATANQLAPTPTVVPTHVPTPTPAPTHAPTPTLAATPPPTPTPAPAAPATLDLQPLSMSIVGHLDCTKTMVYYVCQARVLSRAANQSTLHWTAYAANVLGKVVFSPASGNLPPGQAVLVTISVPLTSCAHALFYFQGPINTHTILWAC